MIGYAMLGTNDYENALQFYDKVLAPVGGKRAMDFGTSTAYANGQGAMIAIGAMSQLKRTADILMME